MGKRSPSGGWEGVLGPTALLVAALMVTLGRAALGPVRAIPAEGPSASFQINPDGLPPFTVPVSIAIGTGLLLSLVAVGLRRRQVLRPGALGHARRASGRDLRPFRPKQSGRMQPTSVRLGRHHRAALHLPAEDHLLVLGPTGSGKSSALAIPAILEWQGPVVVTDPKGELIRTTMAARRTLGRVATFSPLMRPSDRWSPVTAVRSAEDALRTAGFLMGRPPDREPFWHDLALQLLQGLLVEAASTQLSLGDVVNLLQAVPADEVPAEVTHPVARRLTQGALSGGDRTAMGVVATLISKLAPYATEQVAEATASSSFDPAEIASGRLMTLYCLVTPHDAPLLRGLVSSLLACCWRAIYAAPPGTPVLFVLDEFAQLTLLPELPALVQLGRSQGVRMVLMAQDLGSIAATYGAETSSALWANCRTKMLLPGISEIELLERASKLAGSTTLHRGDSGDRAEPVAAHPLLAPDEIRRLPEGGALLLRGSGHPAVIRQRRWYSEPALARLVKLPLEPSAVPQVAAGRPLAAWAAEPRWTDDQATTFAWVTAAERVPEEMPEVPA